MGHKDRRQNIHVISITWVVGGHTGVELNRLMESFQG